MCCLCAIFCKKFVLDGLPVKQRVQIRGIRPNNWAGGVWFLLILEVCLAVREFDTSFFHLSGTLEKCNSKI